MYLLKQSTNDKPCRDIHKILSHNMNSTSMINTILNWKYCKVYNEMHTNIVACIEVDQYTFL